MRCIFCKSTSNSFKSVEHIIPESLGNKTIILPSWIVCDKCNNYFARKVEGELLNSDFFKHARFRNLIPNKKGIIPPIEPIIGSGPSLLGMYRTQSGLSGIYPLDDKSEKSLLNHLNTQKHGKLYIPLPANYNRYIMSRFLAKIGIELLTSRVMSIPGWEEEVIFKSELDLFRNYARYGSPPKEWNFFERRIYDEDQMVIDDDGNEVEILNEIDLLFSNGEYLFCVVCIFGIEYTIDMANPDVSLYIDWLKNNNYISPLYRKK